MVIDSEFKKKIIDMKRDTLEADRLFAATIYVRWESHQKFNIFD